MTTMSASSSAPERRRMPVSVKVSIWSVTTEAFAPAKGCEEVAVGHEAQPLVPGRCSAA